MHCIPEILQNAVIIDRERSEKVVSSTQLHILVQWPHNIDILFFQGPFAMVDISMPCYAKCIEILLCTSHVKIA